MAKFAVGDYVYAEKDTFRYRPEIIGIVNIVIDKGNPQYLVTSIDGSTNGMSFFCDERLLSK